MTEKIAIGVIFGGRSGEHEVSLMSARSVLAALNTGRYAISEIGITKDGRWLSGPDALACFEEGQTETLTPVFMLPEPDDGQLYLRSEGGIQVKEHLDVLLPVLHGSFGEDGSMQGLLELADVPYVGAGVLASAVAMDKGLFKGLMRAHEIPVLDWVVFNTSDLEQGMDAALDRAEQVGPYPLFTKPANLGSSVGISRCENRSDLIEGLQDAARYDRRVLVELGIEAREIEVSVLGNEAPQASIAGEVVPNDAFYSYEAKYLKDTSELVIPAPIDDQVMGQARKIAIEAYQAIDGAGMARVDFLLERGTGELYLNEINTIPGFTKISMYPKLWEASGVPYSQLLDKLVDFAMERFAQKAGLVRSYGVEQ